MHNLWFIEAEARNRQAEVRRQAALEQRTREAWGCEPRLSYLHQLFDLLGAAWLRWSISKTQPPVASYQPNDCVAC
jgi:hypothetical protein